LECERLELDEQQRTGRTTTNNGVTAKTTKTNAVWFCSFLFVRFVVVRVIIVPSVSVRNVSEAGNSGTALARARSFRRVSLTVRAPQDDWRGRAEG
jgi:hypothetical protein